MATTTTTMRMVMVMMMMMMMVVVVVVMMMVMVTMTKSLLNDCVFRKKRRWKRDAEVMEKVEWSRLTFTVSTTGMCDLC